MLPSVSSLNSQILALPPTLSRSAGAAQFINVIANFLNQIQAGPTGSPGIFTYANAPAIAALEALQPTDTNSWITNFANAIHAGSTAATLTPGTVTSPSWTASGVDTLPPTIITLSSALSTLISDLAVVTAQNNPATPMAQAISSYGLAFTFQCTGLVLNPPGSPFPLPLTFPAQ